MNTISKETIAKRNIHLQKWINFLSGIVFLTGVITLFYKYTGLTLPEIILIVNVSSFTVRLLELPTSVFADTAGRKKSLTISVICNFASAILILIYPTFIGFIIASICSGFYFAFRSGTGQAFLEENLRVIGEEKSFGKVIGHLMSMETLAGLITPLIIAGILKVRGDFGYTVMAALDVIFAFILILLTIQLKEIGIIEKVQGIKNIIRKNRETAKSGLQNVFHSKKLRIFLIYRSLANHVAFLYVVSLPIRVENGMEPWMAGVFGTIGGIGMLLASKYAYKFAEKYSYNHARVVSTIAQGILLIIAGFFLKSRILVTIVMIFFNFFEGLRMPARNHVLVEQTKGVAIATTRSIIFGIFALYTTLGKQILSFFPVEYALIGVGIFILLVNIIRGRKILNLQKEK